MLCLSMSQCSTRVCAQNYKGKQKMPDLSPDVTDVGIADGNRAKFWQHAATCGRMEIVEKQFIETVAVCLFDTRDLLLFEKKNSIQNK